MTRLFTLSSQCENAINVYSTLVYKHYHKEYIHKNCNLSTEKSKCPFSKDGISSARGIMLPTPILRKHI